MPKVFFSWQSDQARKSCKDIIRSALDSAASQLNTEISEADRIEVESDTEGEPGAPEIFKTICRKIDECDVFVADLTISSRLVGPPTKAMPNSNVLIEYGYALKSKGREKIVAVWNGAFNTSSAEELPFNLRHARAPQQFNVTSEAKKDERDQSVKQLAKFFVEAIGLALRQEKVTVAAANFSGQQPLESDRTTFYAAGSVVTNDGDTSSQNLKVTLEPNKGNIYLRAIPKKALRLPRGEIRKLANPRAGLVIATGASSGSYGNNELGFISYGTIDTSDAGRRRILDFVQYFSSGEVWCVNGSYLNHGNDISEHLFSVVNNMLSVAKDWIAGLATHSEFVLEAGFSGLIHRRVRYGNEPGQVSEQFYQNDFWASFDKPQTLDTQKIKDALWGQVRSEV